MLFKENYRSPSLGILVALRAHSRFAPFQCHFGPFRFFTIRCCSPDREASPAKLSAEAREFSRSMARVRLGFTRTAAALGEMPIEEGNERSLFG